MADGRGCLRRSLFGLLLVLLLIGAAGVAVFEYMPYRNFGGETFVEVQHGMSSGEIARLLEDRGVVRSRWAFLLVRAVHPRATLQAGEYRFDSAETPWEVFRKIRLGEIFFEEFTVPEGSNMFEIAGILGQKHTVKPNDFLKAAADPASIRDVDPTAPDLEGYLFPSTYRVTHKTTAKQLCQLMTSEFRKQWAILAPRDREVDLHRVVTLASLVEKETAVPAERRLVSAVFTNRLRLGMALQCDPTTVYAALRENRYRGIIHHSDLASTNPYNTYAHVGLPPGPITNPGVTSLQAALQPAQADYLYFVAKPDRSGSHHFSGTLDEHMKAVADYRKVAH